MSGDTDASSELLPFHYHSEIVQVPPVVKKLEQIYAHHIKT